MKVISQKVQGDTFMINAKSGLKNDSICKSLTGITVKEFNDLLPSFEEAFWEEVNSKPRERAYGAGAKHALEVFEEKLFFILFYVKCYTTFAVLGFLYERDRSKPCDWVKAYLPLLERALGKKCALPKRKINSVHEFLQIFPNTKEIFIDGTERRVQRPKNNDSQKDHYSGKKGTHTKKNLVAVNSKKKYFY